MPYNVKAFDMHVKTLDGVTKQTVLGALMTLVAVVVVLVLFWSEVSTYLTPNIRSRMQADNLLGRDEESVNLHFNVDFMHVPCERISYVQEVVRGQVHTHLSHAHDADIGMKKEAKQYSRSENNALSSSSGCLIHGSLTTDKIAGHMVFKVEPDAPDPKKDEDPAVPKGANFNPKQMGQVIRELHRMPSIPKIPPLHHRINHMMFLPPDGVGSSVEGALSYEKDTKASVRSILKGRGLESEVALQNVTTMVDKELGLYHYNIQVVPMHYRAAKGKSYDQQLNQYSVTERGIETMALAQGGSIALGGQSFQDTYGLVFTYDFYPLILAMEEQSGYFIDFLGSLFGILGGVITIIGLAERCLAQSSKAVMGKKD
jgi:hypothetical protein